MLSTSARLELFFFDAGCSNLESTFFKFLGVDSGGNPSESTAVESDKNLVPMIYF